MFQTGAYKKGQMIRVSRLCVGRSPITFLHKCNIYTTKNLLAEKKLPELTAKRYPNVKRGTYASLTDSDINYFKSLLHDGAVLTETEELEGYNTDWMGMVRGN